MSFQKTKERVTLRQNLNYRRAEGLGATGIALRPCQPVKVQGHALQRP